MERTAFSATVVVAVLLAILGTMALAQQDKYTVRVPGGLAFSEFRGYEAWQVVSISHNGDLLAAALANPVTIRGLRGGHPRQWQAVPRRRQDGENPLEPEKHAELPECDSAGHPA
jgi:hypothetical protein